MIKLKELLDINYPSVDLFSESPLRIKSWKPDFFDSPAGNYTFTIGVKEKAKQIGLFGGFEIYEYKSGTYIINCFVTTNDSGFTVAFIQYKDIGKTCDILRVWQDAINVGLIRQIILNYYLKGKYSVVLTDNRHTELGEKCVYKLLNQAKKLGYKIFVLDNDKEKIYVDDLSLLDKYYSVGTTGLRYKFGIEK